MKILTYNLWDSPAGMPTRDTHIQNTLSAMQADVLCLQEIAEKAAADILADICDCPYRQYDLRSATAVLSKYPIRSVQHHDSASAVILDFEDLSFRIVNAHLPWNSAVLREKAILEIVHMAETEETDYTILAGDFNCSAGSDVHRWLTGECTLQGTDACYFDLAESWQMQSGQFPENTLDFRSNPRWGAYEPANTIEKPQRYDRIYLKNPYPAVLPVLKAFGIFGTEVYRETGLAASDHYGIYAELLFIHQKGSQV